MMEKRHLSMLLAVAMLVSLFSGLPLVAGAEESDPPLSPGSDSPENIDVYFIDGTDSANPYLYFYNSADELIESSEDLAYPGMPAPECLGKEMNGHNYYAITLCENSVDRVIFNDGADSFSTEASDGHTEALSFSADAVTPPDTLGGNAFVVYSVRLCDGVMTVTRECDVFPAESWQRVKEPNCTEKGREAYVGLRTGAESGAVDIPALGHDWGDWGETAAPSCTEKGEEARSCSRCEARETRETPALGHGWDEPSYEWAEDNGSVTATRSCRRDKRHKETETVNTTYQVTREATAEAEGEGVYTATFSNKAFATQTKTVAIPKLVQNPFVDVKESDFFFNPVLWAVANNVTSGTDPTHFSPYATVKRSEAMLFFYAAKGRPKFTTTKSPFKDVKKKHWFYDAVLWAVENKITSGTDATHFSPNKTCIRSENLQFLYAAMGKPGYTIANPYSDVKKKHWYYDGAIWAYENGLEKGSNGKFKAKTPCTRAYVVTYLYRFITGKELVQ